MILPCLVAPLVPLSLKSPPGTPQRSLESYVGKKINPATGKAFESVEEVQMFLDNQARPECWIPSGSNGSTRRGHRCIVAPKPTWVTSRRTKLVGVLIFLLRHRKL